MNAKNIVLILAATLIIPSLFAVNTAFADTTLSVMPTDAMCVQTATPLCFSNIQTAIDYANTNNLNTTNTATASYSILVEPGTYGAITLKAGVSAVHGRETARTFLTGNGSGTAITISNLSGQVAIQNFTIINAAIGIGVSNSLSVISITNNVFSVGSGNIAVQIQGSPSTNITNNTFYLNRTAIIRDAESNQISNNIFSNNAVNISNNIVLINPQNNVTYNDFNPGPALTDIVGTSYIPNTTYPYPDPLFVNINNLDSHLTATSPCIKNGSSNSDMGAYGGSNADTIPFQVAGVKAVTDPATSQISVTWNPNLDYKVTGYKVYYGKKSGGPYDGTVSSGTGSNSPITVPTGTAATSYILTGLTATVSTPGIPDELSTSPLDESLNLSWSAVDGATKYKVYWSESSFDMSSLPTNSVVIENKTYTILPGLTNGKTYYMAVSAIAEAAYYVAVTAVYSAATPSPGISDESIYSTPAPVGAGESKESAISQVVHDYPEALVAYPNLSNSGHKCFIATAAYGYYSAPEVQALRKFRDRYLLTNSAGRAFVGWYYQHGPVAAAYLDAHPGYKPIVRAALMPAVGAALFLTNTTSIIKIFVALFLLFPTLAISYRYFRKRLSDSGGAH